MDDDDPVVIFCVVFLIGTVMVYIIASLFYWFGL